MSAESVVADTSKAGCSRVGRHAVTGLESIDEWGISLSVERGAITTLLGTNGRSHIGNFGGAAKGWDGIGNFRTRIAENFSQGTRNFFTPNA
jgi:hypothetical protein